MFVETIKSEGLAHLSYLVGDGDEAAVIDPRRDCEIYAEMARERGCRITHIFETHRHEDLISGAPILSKLTGAPVHHGPNPADDVVYADTVRDGDRFSFGAARITVHETPGHTDDSVSYALHDEGYGEDVVAVFTGDALFVGDVGRTDFYPDRKEEVAGNLYDSLRKILALGDQAILYPAHGAGSVCGDAMADRDVSTLGFERRNNPMVKIQERAAFIAKKVEEQHHQPPYFRVMERLNLEGAQAAPGIASPPTMSMDAFQDAAKEATIIDVRGIAPFVGAHVPGSLALPADMVPAFAGWFLAEREPLLLVANDATQASLATRHLARIGYDVVEGYLPAAMTGWATGARPFRSVPVVDVEEVARRVEESPPGWALLDVRDRDEIAGGIVPGAATVYVGELPTKLKDLSRDTRHTVMCASGARATIAASILLRAGFRDVDVFLGSLAAWRAAGHELVSAYAVS